MRLWEIRQPSPVAAIFATVGTLVREGVLGKERAVSYERGTPIGVSPAVSGRCHFRNRRHPGRFPSASSAEIRQSRPSEIIPSRNKTVKPVESQSQEILPSPVAVIFATVGTLVREVVPGRGRAVSYERGTPIGVSPAVSRRCHLRYRRHPGWFPSASSAEIRQSRPSK